MQGSRTFGFIGLGLMGQPMCRNLASKISTDEKIRIFDLNDAAMEELSKEFPTQIVKCSSPVDIAEGAQIIITMLPEGRHVESVYISGLHALKNAALDDKVFIDSSTIAASTSLLIRHRITTLFPSASFYDAPVSGGVVGAISGAIAFFVGCDDEADPRFSKDIQPILQLMGKNVVPCGILTIACYETFNIGMRAGLNPKKLYQVLGAGSAQSTICDKFCPVPNVVPDSPSSHSYTGGFRMALMLKDFKLAMQLEKTSGAESIMGRKGLEMYSLLGQEDAYEDLDVRAMFRYFGGQEDWDNISNSDKPNQQ